MMDNIATGHFRLQWVTVVLVVFAVFSWGVQYKLSLYDWPAKTVAATPHAKLLSQKERPIAVHEAVTEIFPPCSASYAILHRAHRVDRGYRHC